MSGANQKLLQLTGVCRHAKAPGPWTGTLVKTCRRYTKLLLALRTSTDTTASAPLSAALSVHALLQRLNPKGMRLPSGPDGSPLEACLLPSLQDGQDCTTFLPELFTCRLDALKYAREDFDRGSATRLNGEMDYSILGADFGPRLFHRRSRGG